MAKVLVVDDSAFMRHRYAAVLHEMGHELLEAETGQQALESYQLHKPDAVLIDVALPGMDGIETLEQLRQLDVDVRIVVVTAVAQHDVVLEAIHAGAGDYVVKPFEPDRLKTAISKLAG